MMKKFKFDLWNFIPLSKCWHFDYDYKNDSLFIYDSRSKSKASVEIDNLIIDYNSKKDVCAIELLNASQFFKDVSPKGTRISKSLISDIVECKLDFISKTGFFVIKFFFKFNSNEELFAPVLVPSINESSPATLA